MADAVRQDVKRQEWKTRLDAQHRRTDLLREALTPALLGRAVAGGGWTAGQVLEHLCISHDSYLGQMGALVAAAAVDPRAVTAHWKPSVMGNFLARSLKSPRKLPAPKVYRPGPEPRQGVLDAFITRQRQLGDLIDGAVAVVWQELRFQSPVTRLIRVNLGDGFEIMVTHAERHLGQIDRLIANRP